MRVRIISGATTVDLATTGRTSTQNLAGAPTRLIQEVPLARAPFSKVFDRGNARNPITFSVTRVHATFQAAELFLLEHPDAVPRSGRVEFITDDGIATRFMDPAVVLITGWQTLGLTTIHTYQVIGGQLKTPTP